MPILPHRKVDLNDHSLVSLLDELPLWSAPFGLKLLEKVVPRKNMTVLDFGYGTGFPLLELAMRLGDTCKVYGIDPWQAATARAKEKIRLYGINNVELLNIGETQNIASLQSLGQSFDLIVSNNGLNNVEDMESASRILSHTALPMAAPCSGIFSSGWLFSTPGERLFQKAGRMNFSMILKKN